MIKPYNITHVASPKVAIYKISILPIFFIKNGIKGVAIKLVKAQVVLNIQ